jgi:membrane-associated phospholipid phosphatase
MHSTIYSQRSAAGERESRLWKPAMLWLAFLGPFFFISYGFTNWWTSRLSHVDSFFFEWERHIPFWDWTILPYMSIDAFYAGSLFVCSTRAELNTHAKRLLSATLISVAGFLLFPLQFSFVRPPTTGFNGALFDVLTGFDKPFNQAPSLHISLLMLLWVVYARHLRGAALWLLHFWFLLIGISVFTTYQHHIIDGFAGAAVGILCLYIFPDHPTHWHNELSLDSSARRRLQRLYLLGAVICFALAYFVHGWAWLLLWPGTALLLVSLAYARFGISIFQKHEGRFRWPAYALLLPYQIGAWMSSRWFTRDVLPSAEVVPGVWIGRVPGQSDWRHFQPAGILDLTAEFNAGKNALAVRYKNIPMLDLVVPSTQQLQCAVEALDSLYAHGPVLIHCALGYSRSALVISAWLLQRGFASTAEQAVEQVRTARPRIVFPPAYQTAIRAYSNV